MKKLSMALILALSLFAMSASPVLAEDPGSEDADGDSSAVTSEPHDESATENRDEESEVSHDSDEEAAEDEELTAHHRAHHEDMDMNHHEDEEEMDNHEEDGNREDRSGVSAVDFGNITGSSARITWNTGDGAEDNLFLGTTYPLVLSESETEEIESQSQDGSREANLSGLEPNTTYYFRVGANDPEQYSFSTLGSTSTPTATTTDNTTSTSTATTTPSTGSTSTTTATTTPSTDSTGSQQAGSGQATTTATTTATTIQFTLADVRSHNDPESCWFAIEDSVYNLTPLIAAHPEGGRELIGLLCGVDGTQLWNAQFPDPADRDPDTLLGDFKVGTLRSD